MARLWKVTAKRNNSSVKQGMNVEIMTKANKPDQGQIAEALSNKYNTDVNRSHCGSTVFEFEKIS